MKLILIRGLPGSGKSTLAKLITDTRDNSIHLEADQYFINEAGEYNWQASKIRDAHLWCLRSAEQYLQQEFVVVVSNTFTTKAELKPYFSMAKELGVVPSVIVCQNNWSNIHSVPEETLQKMSNRFQYDISELFNG